MRHMTSRLKKFGTIDNKYNKFNENKLKINFQYLYEQKRSFMVKFL